LTKPAGGLDIFQTVCSGLKTGRRIFYLKVEKVEEGKRRLLKTYSTSLTSRFIKFFMY
jgi:hypothetical protein